MRHLGIMEWFRGLFNKDGELLLDTHYSYLQAEIYFKELAVQACVNLIANAVARSEFLTFEKGQEVRKDNYYLFNVEPNQNKSSSKFWRDVIHKLVYDNECLVIQQNDMFYVADSYAKKEFAFKENIYRDIVVGDYSLINVYRESQVFHFELHDKKIKDLVEGIYRSYGNLIEYSKSNYKRSNAKRGTLEIPVTYPQTEKAQADIEKLLNQRFKKFFEAEGGAVLPLTNGLKYEDLTPSGYKSGSDSRDIRALVDDIFDYTAIAFQIPPQLIKGNIADTDKATNNLLTFCINPVAELLTDEINRKYYGKKLFLEKTYIKLDSSRIKTVDIKDIASSLDILFRVGVNTINDNLRTLGRETINADYANEHYVTKNYERVKVKGGG